MRTLILATLVASSLTWGCAGTGSPSSGPTNADRNRITREQLEVMPSMTARDAVQRYRRDWLTGRTGSLRGSGSRTYPSVFLDGRPYGSLDVLAQLETEHIEELRYISGSDATTRYGTGYPAGIIDVITRRDRVSSPPEKPRRNG
jgi:hypothetical protein